MAPLTRPWRYLDLWLALGLLLLAAGLRLWGLTGTLLIDDECFYTAMSQRPLGFILRHCLESPTYPGWFLPAKAWAAVFGGTDLAVRGHSLFWGLLAVLATAGLGREVGGRRAGVLAGGLLATSGYHIYFSQTASPYALLSFLGAAATLCLLRLLRGGGRRDAVLLALLLTCACYSHIAGLMFWLAQLCAVLLLALAGRRAHLRAYALSQGLTLVLSAGAAYIVLRQLPHVRRVGFPYVPEVDLAVVGDTLHQLLAYRAEQAFATPLWALAGLLLLARGAQAALRTLRRPAGGPGPAPWPEAALLVIGVLPLLGSVAGAVLVDKSLLYAPRIFSICVPAALALLASGLSALGRARPWALALALPLVLLPQVGSLAFLTGEGRRLENFPVQEVSRLLRARGRPGDVAVIHDAWFKQLFDRYYPHRWPRIVGAVYQQIEDRPFGGVRDPLTPAALQEVLDLARSHRRLWLVLTPEALRLWRDPRGLLQAALDARFRAGERTCLRCDGPDPVWVTLYPLDAPGAAPRGPAPPGAAPAPGGRAPAPGDQGPITR